MCAADVVIGDVSTYGSLDEVAWTEVPKADIDIYKWVDSVEYEAYGQLVYIENYGFICRMTCIESDPLNDIFKVTPVVEADQWSLTMDIPISKLQKFYGNSLNADTFVSGYTFTGNFYKIGSDAVTGVRHYGMWTEVDGNSPNFHQPSCFGTFVIE